MKKRRMLPFVGPTYPERAPSTTRGRAEDTGAARAARPEAAEKTAARHKGKNTQSKSGTCGPITYYPNQSYRVLTDL